MERNRTITFTEPISFQGHKLAEAGSVHLATVDGNGTVRVPFPEHDLTLYCVKGFGTNVPRLVGRQTEI